MKKGLFGIVCLLWICIAYAQDSVRTTTVYLEHSETLTFDQERLPDAQILTGDVRFRHDSALMYCDSAYFFEKSNSLHAFGHVRMFQGDSIQGFGDMLFYDGNTRMARLRKHVKLIHQSTILTTDSLNYDRKINTAYYFAGGRIVDSLNTLSSRKGIYTPDNYQAVFRDRVKLENPKFILTADTLCYNTQSYRSDLVGPTRIVYDTATTILSSKGWYNTQTERSMLLKRSKIIHQDGRSLVGDTIYYDKKRGYGLTIGNIESIDSANHLTLYGQRSEMWEHQPHGYVTDSAMLVDWSDSTMYSYMHADTLFTETIPYTLFTLVNKDSIWIDSVKVAQAPDTIFKDTSFQQVRAFYHVRIYREDMQAVADSIRYHGRDSILSLYGTPVCWNQNNQVSADSIHVYIKNENVDFLHGIGNALGVKQEGMQEFDQLGGKEMIAYIRDNEVYLVDVKGNAETIFYPREEDGSWIGVNRTQSSFVKLYIEERRIHHVVFTPASSGILYPMAEATPEITHLTSFFWADAERPKRPGDIFLRPERTHRPEKAAISASEEEDVTDIPTESRTPKKSSKRKAK